MRTPGGTPPMGGAVRKGHGEDPADHGRRWALRGAHAAGTLGLLVALAATGCLVDRPPYECAVDGECVLSGVRGRCEPSTQYCSFPDRSCPTGFRYGAYS